MISLKIPEVKVFMAKLLTNNAFDFFLLREMQLQTFTNFNISGQLNDNYYTNEELEERGDDSFVQWSEVRQFAFSIIKGNKPPLSLKIIFQLPKGHCETMIERSGEKLRWEEIGGLFLNVRFEKGELHIITGAAIKTFLLDKTIEQVWDMEVKNILRVQGIVFEEE